MHLSHLPDHYQPDYCRDTLKIPPSCPHDAAAPLTHEYRNNQFPQFIFVENFSTNARPTYARESPISSFFFFLFSKKKEEKRISTNFDRSRWTTTNFALFGLRICNHLNYSKRDVVATQKLDAFRSIHRAFVAGFVSKKKREKERKRNERGSNRLRSISSMQCCNELIFDDGNGCRLIRSTEQPL